jgi:hypothetical protein
MLLIKYNFLIKSRKAALMGHVACVEEKVLMGKPDGKRLPV